MTTNNIMDVIERVTDSMEKVNWVHCPHCKMEWTKLRPCPYFDGKEKMVTYMCVECAESLKSINVIMAIDPIVKPYENWAEDWIKVRSYGHMHYGDAFLPRSVRTMIRVYPGTSDGNDPVIEWELYSEGQGVSIRDMKENVKIEHYDNTIQAWKAVKRRVALWVEKFEKASKIEKKSWNIKKMRCFLFWI